MGKILEFLAREGLSLNIITSPSTPEQEKAGDLCRTLQIQLNQRLNEEDRRLLNQFVDATIAESFQESATKFARGFQLGALLFMEILQDQDTFLKKENSNELNK